MIGRKEEMKKKKKINLKPLGKISQSTIIGIICSLLLSIITLIRGQFLWASAWALLFIVYAIDIYEVFKNNKK